MDGFDKKRTGWMGGWEGGREGGTHLVRRTGLNMPRLLLRLETKRRSESRQTSLLVVNVDDFLCGFQQIAPFLASIGRTS